MPAELASALVRVASALFAQHGYHAVSVRAIASAVHSDVAALYYHYRSKDDLLVAVLAPYLAEQQAVRARSGSVRDLEARQRDLLEGLMAARIAHPSAAAIVQDPSVRDHPVLGVRLRADDAASLKILERGLGGASRRHRAGIALAVVRHAPTVPGQDAVTLEAALRALRG